MRKLFYPQELNLSDSRISLVPEAVGKLKGLGAEIYVEQGLGLNLGFTDQEYQAAGVEIVANCQEGLEKSEIILMLRPPSPQFIEHMKPNQLLISHLNPFNAPDIIKQLISHKISAIAMELIPRTTIAQKMDALSSQANLSGYVAVLQAAQHLGKVIPMMMTPAGTIRPARFFVVGVGVAGLQAIATAKRLGARVDAFDTRPVVEEQVKSLGAKFLKIDLGETGQTQGGYATALTEEQIERQRLAMIKQCSLSDVVITTAQVFGRKAPILITEAMIKQMRHGSVIVDAAIDHGGNVEGSRPGEIVTLHGVKIIGLSNLPGLVATDASLMYCNNIVNFISHFWNTSLQSLDLKLDDEIIRNALVTHKGELIQEGIRQRIAIQEKEST